MTQKVFFFRLVLFISIIAFFTALSFSLHSTNQFISKDFINSPLTGAVVDVVINDDYISNFEYTIFYMKNNELIQTRIFLTYTAIKKY
jgi:hypothetical protein